MASRQPCPVCRSEQQGDGLRVFACLECPMCMEETTLMGRFPCGHLICESCFLRLGWTLSDSRSSAHSQSVDQIFAMFVSKLMVILEIALDLLLWAIANRSAPIFNTVDSHLGASSEQAFHNMSAGPSPGRQERAASSSNRCPRQSMALVCHHDGHNLFWVGADSKLHQKHLGRHNSWKWQSRIDNAPGMSSSSSLVAGRNSNSFGVFWASTGRLHEMHMGSYNGWKFQMSRAGHHAPGLLPSSPVALIYHNDAKNIFWAGSDGKLHELHQGKHNSWRWEHACHDVPDIAPQSTLVAGRNSNSMGVFWASATGTIYEMHQGSYNGWRWQVAAHQARSLQLNGGMALIYHEDEKSLFHVGSDSRVHQLHMGRHNGWRWQSASLGAEGVTPESILVASRNSNCKGVFWTGSDGCVHEMHKGNYNGWRWGYSKHPIPGRRLRGCAAVAFREAAKSLFVCSADGHFYELHQGQHNNWQWHQEDFPLGQNEAPRLC